MSAPHVSGLAALVLARFPGSSPEEVREIIEKSAEKVGNYDYNVDQNFPGFSYELGAGRINAFYAVAPPAAPENLNAQLKPYGYPYFRAYLTWSANTEPDLTGYQIFRKITQGGAIIEDWNCIAFVTGTSFTDYNLPILTGGECTLYYKIRAKDFTNQFSEYSDPALIENVTVFPKPVVDKNDVPLPNSCDLKNNFPNPFNPETTISFDLPEESFVNLVVYNIQGERVATIVNDQLSAGSYHVNFDALNLPSGLYFYKITAGSFSQIKRMLLIK